MPRVYRKRYSKKKSMRRYRKRYTRRVPRSLGNPKQKIFYYTRFCDLGTITSTSASTTYGASSFNLSQVPGYTDFTALYDFYKIKAIKLSFVPWSNVTNGNSGTEHFQRIFTVIDYNDVGIPTAVTDLQQYKSCKWSPNNRIHKRYFKPKTIIDSYNELALVLDKQPWVPTTNTTNSYYGIKWAIESQINLTTLYKIEAKFYLAFKSPI